MDNRAQNDIIVAQCTPQGKGALALIRVSGQGAIALVSGCAHLSSGILLHELPSHTLHYGSVVDDTQELIDRVLFLLMKAPRTFTGVDTVEITCHNNQFIITRILNLFIARGARIALPGEFTRWALINEKIDLLQAEAIEELLHAVSFEHTKCALKQLQGSFSAWIYAIEERLLHMLALVAASFEFIEEEQMEFGDQVRVCLQELLDTVAGAEHLFDAQLHIKQGFRIALVGSVNAGKSSLFNTLLQKNRAIVSSIAGTTRDVIEASLSREGTLWTMIDTAGLRLTDDQIEQEGIERSFQEATGADILLLVQDSSRMITIPEREIYEALREKYGHKIIEVYNKIDQAILPLNEGSIGCSALSGRGISELWGAIEEKVHILKKKQNLPFLVNERHMLLLQGIKRNLMKVVTLCEHIPMAYELVSFELHDTLVQLSELSGRTVDHAVMDRVFSTFCVGK